MEGKKVVHVKVPKENNPYNQKFGYVKVDLKKSNNYK